MLITFKWSLSFRFSYQNMCALLTPPYMHCAPSVTFSVIWSFVAKWLANSGMKCNIFSAEVLLQCCKSLSQCFKGKYVLYSSTAYFAAEVFLQPWISTVCIVCGPNGLLFVPHFIKMIWYFTIYYCVGTGKSRYGICVNFYRPMERVPPGGGLGGARSDRHSSTFRRESWRKSIEKSSDSAFSRLVSFPVQRWAGLCFCQNYKHYTVFILRVKWSEIIQCATRSVRTVMKQMVRNWSHF